ncbi:MAG TPA: hypothetical protein VFN61_05350 [Acidimicrobiales bacterium]|nr:hypothetical protein [Acidimicrobiales bacterium]
MPADPGAGPRRPDHVVPGPDQAGPDRVGGRPDYVEEMPTLPPQEATVFGLRWRGNAPAAVGTGSQPDIGPEPDAGSEQTLVLPAIPGPLSSEAQPSADVPTAVLEPVAGPPGQRAPAAVPPEQRALEPRHQARWAIGVVLVIAAAGLVVGLWVTQPGQAPAEAVLQAGRQVVGAQALVGDGVRWSCQAGASSPGTRSAAAGDVAAARQSLEAAGKVLAMIGRTPDGPTHEVVADLRALASGESAVVADVGQWVQDREVAGCYSAPRNDLYYDRALARDEALSPVAARLASDWSLLSQRYRLPALPRWEGAPWR